jgi:tRNA dimethylallyltransferase
VAVFRDFVIGCAKPSADERARVPHHLIDVVGWNDNFDAQRYLTLARGALGDIARRGKLPVVCGGTGLYLRALRFGLVDVPAADADLRQRLYDEEARAPGTLYARLRQLDLETAQRTEPHNLVHVIRALEIIEVTGEPASRVRARHGFRGEEVPMRVIALSWPNDVLRDRIRQRAAAMVDGGLLDEVRGLLAQGVSPEARPMRAVGYKEAVAVAQGSEPKEGLAERIAKSTIAYARRQRTWLRREPNVTWLEVTDVDQAGRDVVRLFGAA